MGRFVLGFALILGSLFALQLTPPGQAVVQPWTSLVAQASAAFIRAFDGDALSQGIVLFSTKNGFAVSIEAGCNGVEAMLVLLAGVLAWPTTWRWKLIGLASGAVAIQALNLVRIVSLFYLGQWNREWFEWAHLYLWQTLIMVDALIVWLVWIRHAPPVEASAEPRPA